MVLWANSQGKTVIKTSNLSRKCNNSVYEWRSVAIYSKEISQRISYTHQSCSRTLILSFCATLARTITITPAVTWAIPWNLRRAVRHLLSNATPLTTLRTTESEQSSSKKRAQLMIPLLRKESRLWKQALQLFQNAIKIRGKINQDGQVCIRVDQVI